MGDVDRPAEDFRAWARGQWGELGEQAGRVLSIALDAKKTIRRTVTCSSCGVRQQKEIQVGDARIALDALGWLTESGFGRAPTAQGEAGGGNMVFVNSVALAGCPNCGCEDCGYREEKSDGNDGPGIWKLVDRRDRSEVTFLSYSDMLIYVQEMDEAERGGTE